MDSIDRIYNMKRQIYLSTFSEDAMQVISSYGVGVEYNQLCISSSLDEDAREGVLQEMREDAKACGLMKQDQPDAIDPKRALVHGPFTELIPSAIDPRAVELCRCRMDEAAQATMELGLNRLVLHSGYYPTIYFPQWHVAQSIDFWKKFLDDKPENFTVLVENVFDDEPDPLYDIVAAVDDPRFRICLDVGHANAASKANCSVYDWIKKLGSYVEHFHLHNNDGSWDTHSPLLQGSMDMERVLAAIDSYCPKEATLTIESRECEESVAWLLEHL